MCVFAKNRMILMKRTYNFREIRLFVCTADRKSQDFDLNAHIKMTKSAFSYVQVCFVVINN